MVTEGEQKETSNVEQTKSSGTVPYLKYTHGQGLKISSITFHRLKQDLKDAYLAMLSEDRSRLEQNEETHGQLICAIGIMAFDEMISNPR